MRIIKLASKTDDWLDLIRKATEIYTNDVNTQATAPPPALTENIAKANTLFASLSPAEKAIVRKTIFSNWLPVISKSTQEVYRRPLTSSDVSEINACMEKIRVQGRIIEFGMMVNMVRKGLIHCFPGENGDFILATNPLPYPVEEMDRGMDTSKSNGPKNLGELSFMTNEEKEKRTNDIIDRVQSRELTPEQGKREFERISSVGTAALLRISI